MKQKKMSCLSCFKDEGRRIVVLVTYKKSFHTVCIHGKNDINQAEVRKSSKTKNFWLKWLQSENRTVGELHCSILEE